MDKKMVLAIGTCCLLTILFVQQCSKRMTNAFVEIQQEREAERLKFMKLCIQDEKEYKCEVLWKASR